MTPILFSASTQAAGTSPKLDAPKFGAVEIQHHFSHQLGMPNRLTFRITPSIGDILEKATINYPDPTLSDDLDPFMTTVFSLAARDLSDHVEILLKREPELNLYLPQELPGLTMRLIKRLLGFGGGKPCYGENWRAELAGQSKCFQEILSLLGNLGDYPAFYIKSPHKLQTLVAKHAPIINPFYAPAVKCGRTKIPGPILGVDVTYDY